MLCFKNLLLACNTQCKTKASKKLYKYILQKVIDNEKILKHEERRVVSSRIVIVFIIVYSF